MVQSLVKYTELQQLWYSTQTGDRLELGTIHLAFALQHVIDKQPTSFSTSALWISNQHMTRSSGISSGGCCKSWGCMATCWVLCSPCMMALCCHCGLLVSVAPARVHPLASHRTLHSVPPSSASSLTVCTNICRSLLQLLDCKAGIFVRQTWYMLMTSASWPAAQNLFRLSLMLWLSTVLH